MLGSALTTQKFSTFITDDKSVKHGEKYEVDPG
jgi:hypothetical protein